MNLKFKMRWANAEQKRMEIIMLADSPYNRSTSGRHLRASTTENDSSNAHLNLKNYRHQHSDSINSVGAATVSSTNAAAANAPSSSFFVQVTGSIESATASSMSKKLYCRYTFSYGPDWEVVHGVSMGLSQIGRQGVLNPNTNDDERSVVVWNFPIEISFQSTNPYGWPRLALSVYGFDFLGRDVVCGYASLLLPINPGRHVKQLKTYRPVSGGKCQQFVNWLMGTNPEYYDSKMVCKGEGRGVTRVVGDDGMVVKVNLFITRKDFNSFGYSSQSRE
jgi:B9 domain-containing protein 1